MAEDQELADAEMKLVAQAFGERTDLAIQYHDLLTGPGVEWGLIGPREANRLWTRHILNCVAIRTLIPQNIHVLDVGSGAGLPGIPLVLARPDLHIVLLDSLSRRITFLEMTVRQLGLTDQVDIVRARAEQTNSTYHTVVCRAVAPLRRLVEWCDPLFETSLLALKGDGVDGEVADAAALLQERHLAARVIKLQAEAPATVVALTR